MAREILADNLARLMEHHMRDEVNRPRKLSTITGLSLSSVQRVLSAKTGPSIDTIEAVASAFGLAPYQILIPGLNPAAPDEIESAHTRERKLFAQLRSKA